MSDINGSKAVKGNDKRHGKAGNRRSGNRRIPRSSKELLGYDSMLSNGIAYLGGDRWSVSLRISDINYQVATQDQQLDVVDRWGRFLNSVGENMGVQITVATRMLDPEEVTRSIAMPLRGDMLDGLRGDFNRNVRRRLAGRSQGAVTDKYLTLTLRERDGERAVTLLNRAVLRATAQLRSVGGCVGVRLDRRSRLEVLHGMLRRGTRFMFDEDGFLKSHGMSTKDYVAPFAVDVSDRRRLRLSSGTTEVWHQCLLVRDFPDYLSDQLVSSITDIKADITVGIHLSPRGKAEGLKLVNRTIAEMDMQAIDERRKNRKQHLPEDMLPHDLQESMSQAGELRDDLEHNGDRLVDSLMIVDVSADSREQLGQTVRDVTAAIDGQSCVAETLAYMQVEGLNAVLPLGNPLPPMRRTLTTSSAAILVPFTSQELFEPGGVFHGANARTGNPVVIDRTKGMNGNGFILGTTGSGKSQAAKNEITQIYLTRPDDDLIVIDPEHEFTPLCDGLGGERVEIGESSRAHINALDIEYEDDSEGDPIRSKCASVLNMLGVLIGGQDGIDRMQRSLIDRTVIGMYREVSTWWAAARRLQIGKPVDGYMGDGWMWASSARKLGYPTGGDIQLGDVASFTKGYLGASTDYGHVAIVEEIKDNGMLVVLDQIWNRVVRNRRLGRRTWLWVDEFHLLFSNRYAAEYFLRLYKRARKWGLSPTGITQNIEELLANQDARLMLANSDFLLLLNQTATDADALCELLKLSDEQRAFFTGVQPGQGMAKSGTAFIPFDGRIDTDSPLYGRYTTKFEDRKPA
ncbi:VirB4-like conjugal transfer ATPase, CD1110 family [Bifidobacterium longum]|uniref:VirB4-like conjugal transfer ATPase, CD1110 family n=1 Tax=Bifidobacterium longum TaxID=216816 RepID=UPI00084A195B|nr:CHAP domain-containing protein [Bifidobacterium longum]AOP01759.1 putative TrsE-like protein [Bifidobacterium longum subsp. longum]